MSPEAFWNKTLKCSGTAELRVAWRIAGKPAHLWVMLASADGTRLPGYVKFFLQTNPDGSYAIGKIPPGRYMVLVNPDGPYHEWPYDIQYYPAALTVADAQVFDLSKGQQVKRVISRFKPSCSGPCSLSALAQRQTESGAHICVAYERTKEFGSLEGTNGIKDTDQAGGATIHLYGSSRVRVFAEQFVDNPKKKWWGHVLQPPIRVGGQQDARRRRSVLDSPKP